jgi:hypothetical protein
VDDAVEHRCSVDGGGGAPADPASLALMAKIGKRCPKCANVIQKTEGCHIMMCGTTAHGSVRDALRNGGCAHIFNWNCLSAINDGHGYTEMDGRSVDS